MIPLAQYLTEFADDGDASADEASTGGASARAAFTPLKLVKAAASKPEPKSVPSLPIADFGADAGSGDEEFDPALLDDLENDLSDITPEPTAEPAAPEIDMAALVEDARREAREQALEEAQAAHAEELQVAIAAERERALTERDEAMQAARQEWCAEEGSRFASLLSARLDQIAAVTNTALYSVLKPLAIDARRRQSVEELAGAATLLLADGRAFRLSAKGPQDLLDAFLSALGTASARVDAEADDEAVDLRITCDQTIIETRVASWRDAVHEALS